MKTTSNTLKTILFVLLTFTLNIVQADILYQNPEQNTIPPYAFHTPANESNYATYADGIDVVNATTNQAFHLFCGDLYTYTSSSFSDPNVGENYGAMSLEASTLYSQMQKQQLNSLFSHVYLSLYDSDYDKTSQLLQLAVWEIIHESTDDVLSLRSGSMYVDKVLMIQNGPNGENQNYWDQSGIILNETLTILDSWFNAIANNSWSELGYQYTNLPLTVYLAEGGNHASQTFISTVAPAATPEPATMLIFTLGLAGLPALLRHRKYYK
ncbi:MAG: PEP-CTERM sorting domain-containing protein [Planctomycetaceae bacterium]|nr:PEP-CTERM sorting domain-containing protein [Planctomycetaceae bacterium]